MLPQTAVIMSMQTIMHQMPLDQACQGGTWPLIASFNIFLYLLNQVHDRSLAF